MEVSYSRTIGNRLVMEGACSLGHLRGGGSTFIFDLEPDEKNYKLFYLEIWDRIYSHQYPQP